MLLRTASLLLPLLTTLPSALAADPPSVDSPPRLKVSNPADVAVVVGNEDYAFLEDVPYATRDA